MAQTSSAETLHGVFRFYYNRGNSQVMPAIAPDEIDLLLNYTQRQIQADEFRAYRSADGKGFEATKERKRNLQVFINKDPIIVDFRALPVGQPARWELPKDHRYTVSGEISWRSLEKSFFPVNPYTHDEWKAAEQNAFQKPSYWEPALVSHGDVEEVLPQIPGIPPAFLRVYYCRLPKDIILGPTPAQSFGMELPSFLEERLVQEAVTRAKFIVENQGANFQAALASITK
jgi:hypothetical protein